MSTVLVTGGTGRLGRELLPRLVAAGHEVRALVRRPDAALPPGVEAVLGDLAAPPQLPARAFEGVEHIVHLASGSSGGDIEGIDLAGTRTLIEAARAAGGPHLLYLSIVGVEKSAFPLYRAKVEVEVLLAASGLPWTSLRTTQFHELIWDVFDQPPPSPFLAQGMRYQPLAAAEVAEFVVELLTRPPANGIIEMGGPEVLEASELASIFAEVMGRPVPALRRAPSAGNDLDALLAPDHREGQETWREFLEARPTSRTP
jgi:uncharacterized protein YbjT (DUF2867 family)